jgi:hypothetical protein
LYILIFKFFDSRREDRRYWTEWSYHSNTVFKLQKRIIRIMVGIRSRESCREYIKKLKILPLQSQYIYLPLSFVMNNRQHFKINLYT